MRVATGKVVDGKVVLQGERLSEGTVVTVVVHDGSDAFDTTPEEEHALLEAIAQADRGQVISWEQLRARLRHSA